VLHAMLSKLFFSKAKSISLQQHTPAAAQSTRPLSRRDPKFQIPF
jgi:hypothetical protein